MNVALFVAEIDQVGGAELATLRLGECLHDCGIEVCIVTTQGLRRWLALRGLHDYANGLHLMRLPVWQRNAQTFNSTLLFEAGWAFPLYLRRTQIFHARGLTTATIRLARVARRIGMKTVCTPMASGTYGDLSRFAGDLRRIAAIFDHIAAMTDTMRDEIAATSYPATRISVIPNGVDPSFFKPLNPPQNEPQVVFVGQFRPEKRIELLLRAWQDVVIDHPQARLTLVGGGRYLAEYQRTAAMLGDSVGFVPNTDAAGVRAQLQAGSIFVAPGVSEGMSNALLEAMAVGLAPVAADTPASRAVITPEVDGLVYDAESPEALAAQIKRLIADEALRRRLGQAARQSVLRRFSLDNIVDQYIALYRQILGETR